MTGRSFRRSLWKSKKMDDKKILFLDMDGTTLKDDKSLSAENLEALRRAIDAGHEVVMTTGRPAVSARYLLRTHGLDQIGCRYVIAYNGGMMLDCASGEVLFTRTIPIPLMRELILKARGMDVYLQTYKGDYILTERDDENLARYKQTTSMEALVVPDILEALTEEPCKALAIDLRDNARLERFCDEVRAMAGDRLDLYFSSRVYLEVVPIGINKGEALRAFCEKKKIPIANTIAAGDENNDLAMLQAAGVGVAVANAQENVKLKADYVAKRDNNHSAIEEIVEKFLSL